LRRIWKSCATTAIKDENKKSPPTDTDGSKLKS